MTTGMDSGAQRSVHRAARQPAPAPVCWEARENPALHDQGEGPHYGRSRQTLGCSGQDNMHSCCFVLLNIECFTHPISGNWGVSWHLKTKHKTIFTVHSVRCTVSISLYVSQGWHDPLTHTWSLMCGSFWVIKCGHCHLKIMHVHTHSCYTHMHTWSWCMMNLLSEKKWIELRRTALDRVRWSINTVMTVH